ncbi:MAG: FHA domain-containing protein [Hyphomonadaceae bacterium]
MASAECGSLLDDQGLCPVCVKPQLALDAGAAATVREGGKLALPLTISNVSPVGRPLFITALWMKEDDGELREITLPFKRLDPGDTANVGIRTAVLDYAGVHQVDLRVAVATRYQWREEEYVFSSAIIFPVETKDPSGPVTNIHVDGDAGPGFTVYNPTRIENDRAAGRDTHIAAIPLNTIRADRSERLLKRRGYEDGLIVPRGVEFDWSGFDDGDAPFEGPILQPSGLLCFGRNATTLETGANSVRLLVGESGKINKDVSLGISRQHFTIYTESGRLMLRVDSQFGLRVNDQSLGRTKTIALCDGDVIRPLRKTPDALEISIGFEVQQDTVQRILVSRRSR